VWEAERSCLMVPQRPFDGFVEQTKRVSPTCLVHVERNRYSVPASFANRPVSVRLYPERIVVAAEGQIVCEHRRVIERPRTIIPVEPSMIGGIIWPLYRESPAHCATEPPLPRYRKPSNRCRAIY
jgi:hypothetical protein